MAISSNEALSSILQANWSSAGSGLTLADIEWSTSQIDIKKWNENKTAPKNIVSVYCGKNPSTKILYPGAWRDDDELTIEVLVKGDTFANLKQTRNNIADQIKAILKANANTTDNFFIKPKRSTANEAFVYARQVLTVTVSRLL